MSQERREENMFTRKLYGFCLRLLENKGMSDNHMQNIVGTCFSIYFQYLWIVCLIKIYSLKTSSNIKDEEAESLDEAEERNYSFQKEDGSEGERDDGPRPQRSPKKNACDKQNDSTLCQACVIEELKADKKEDDPDKAFLLSCLPDFEKLSDDKKLDFKLHILQFFQQYRYDSRAADATAANSLEESLYQYLWFLYQKYTYLFCIQNLSQQKCLWSFHPQI